jgi:hypothetical protein
MRKEIDPKLAIVIVAVLIAALGFGAWKLWAVPGGLRSPKEAGLGRPMKPGEIPGQSQGVGAPIGPPR